jgi:pilus assembly protein CpaD
MLLLGLAAAVAGCSTTGGGADQPTRGAASVHVPIVTRADYALDLNAADGGLSGTEGARLDGWFRGLDLGFGDRIFVDGDYSGAARQDIARIAGNYGLMVANGAPASAGRVAPGNVRVVVSRSRAEVPGCPDWSLPSSPSTTGEMMSNYGCAYNASLAAQIANPEDLIRGQDGLAYSDAEAGGRAVNLYRQWPLTAVIEGQTTRPLKNSTTSRRAQ